MITWMLVLLAMAAILLIAELLLPSHGVLGVLAGGCYAGVIVLCFMIDDRIGLAVLAVSIVLSPLVGWMLLGVWQKSPIGKRLTLSTVAGKADTAGVMIGQQGVAISELRPSGEAEFNGGLIQARSDGGVIRAGTAVRVIAFADNVATVRAVQT